VLVLTSKHQSKYHKTLDRKTRKRHAGEMQKRNGKGRTHPILREAVRVDRQKRSAPVEREIVRRAGPSVGSGSAATAGSSADCSSCQRLVAARSSSECCGQRSRRDHARPFASPNYTNITETQLHKHHRDTTTQTSQGHNYTSITETLTIQKLQRKDKEIGR